MFLLQNADIRVGFKGKHGDDPLSRELRCYRAADQMREFMLAKGDVLFNLDFALFVFDWLTPMMSVKGTGLYPIRETGSKIG